MRSFSLRQGRVTVAQRKAIETLLPQYRLRQDVTLPAGSDNGFSQSAPLWLEIGFGNGDLLLELGCQMPEINFIGAEVYPPGVGRLLQGLEQSQIGNVRIAMDDAFELLSNRVADRSLSRILLMFPDPWPKKRHHKRRIVNPAFADLLARKLTENGEFHAASDWEPYIEHMLEVLDAHPALENVAGKGNTSPAPAYRIATHFEQRGRALGHGVWDLLYRLKS
ncbi:MAG: tRNA (guanosine(46)-N7)-methyltransferase TrmB [Pseudomonadota bacterium]